MMRERFLLMAAALLAVAAGALAQAPPAPPAPPAVPPPPAAPAPLAAPEPPVPPALLDDLDEVRGRLKALRPQIDRDIQDSVREQLEILKEKRFYLEDVAETARAKAMELAGGITKDVMASVIKPFPFGIALQPALKRRFE